MYIFLCGITKINFEIYIAYSNEEQKHINSLFEGGMLTLTLVLTVVWLVLYNSLFGNVRTRKFTLIAILSRISSTFIFSFIV